MDAKVHIVDDDAGVLQSLNWLFESNGLAAIPYRSAAEFLAIYAPEIAGCLVLDVRMPQMSGLELQREVNRYVLPIPIVFITAHGDVPLCARAMKAGAFDFCEKPIDGPHLVDVVREALAKDAAQYDDRIKFSQLLNRLHDLTTRECQVMTMLCSGKTMKVVAMELGISIQTVAKHRTRMLEKTEFSNETELAAALARLPTETVARRGCSHRS